MFDESVLNTLGTLALFALNPQAYLRVGILSANDALPGIIGEQFSVLVWARRSNYELNVARMLFLATFFLQQSRSAQSVCPRYD
jgi:hypothetical protein